MMLLSSIFLGVFFFFFMKPPARPADQHVCLRVVSGFLPGIDSSSSSGGGAAVAICAPRFRAGEGIAPRSKRTKHQGTNVPALGLRRRRENHKNTSVKVLSVSLKNGVGVQRQDVDGMGLVSWLPG